MTTVAQSKKPSRRGRRTKSKDAPASATNTGQADSKQAATDGRNTGLTDWLDNRLNDGDIRYWTNVNGIDVYHIINRGWINE